jgi:hypothetical protein
MIAKNDKDSGMRHSTAGRNDPCPCGSGKKYKKCCMDTDKDTPQLGPEDMQTVLFAALLQIRKLTRTQRFLIPEPVFDDGALKNMKLNAQYDSATKMWQFWVDPPKQKVVAQPSRRILLP